MNVLKKRFFPYLLVCVMVLTMIAPAFAGSANRATVVDGQYVEAVIDVVLPTTAQAFINPYALPVQLDKLNAESTAPDATDSSRPGFTATDSSIKDQQIVTEPMFIINKSEVNLAVTAKVSATMGNASSTMQFVGEALDEEDNKKDIFAYLQMKVAEDLNAEATAGAMVKAFAGWTDNTYDESKDVIVSVKGGTLSEDAPNPYMAILRAGEASGSSLEATNGSMAMFRITGQVVADPKDPWDKTTDTFKITIAFTFKPDPNKATIKASGAKVLDSTAASIALTVSLTGTDNSKKLVSGNVTWTVDTENGNNNLVKAPNPSASPSNISGTNNVTYTVQIDDTQLATLQGAGKKEVKIIASVPTTSGLTYKAEYTVIINVPSA